MISVFIIFPLNSHLIAACSQRDSLVKQCPRSVSSLNPAHLNTLTTSRLDQLRLRWRIRAKILSAFAGIYDLLPDE